MRFRVASNLPAIVAPQLLPYWVGIDSGIFREQGLGLELVTVQSDQVALTGAANGEWDVVLATPSPPLLTVLSGGLDMVILGATHNAFDSHLVAAADLTEPAALIGKTAIISQKNTLNDFETREALTRLGVDPDTELLGFWMGANQAERVSNLKIGNGQMTVLPLPLSGTLAKEGFVDFGDLSEGPAWPGVAILVGRRTYTGRFDYVQRFLKGLLISIQRTKADPAFAQKVMAGYTKIEDAEALEAAYAVYGDRLLERVPYLSMDGLQHAIDFTTVSRPAVSRLRPNALVDQTVLQRLEGSGYVADLYR
jgi:ABC-type nitrate/sulfonate/bicarbonate transport system substrate-binding protein